MTPTVQPMRGLSKRAQVQAKPKEFCVYSRARRTDPETSHKAAEFAKSQKAAAERQSIFQAIRSNGPMTAREIAEVTGVDYYEVQRRISEVAGLQKTPDSRDGCRVWGLA
jgi:predicted HTH transcriptional regulator